MHAPPTRPSTVALLPSDALRYGATPLIWLASACIAIFYLPTLASKDQAFMASGIALDMTLMAPLAAYFLLVRTGRVKWIAMLPIVVVSFVLATLLIPAQHQGTLEILKFLAAPLEIGFAVFLILTVRKVRRLSRDGKRDFVTQMRHTTAEILGKRVPAEALTTEISMFVFAFGLRRRLPADNSTGWTAHRKAMYGQVLCVFFFVIAVETFAFHLLLSRWSDIAAWILTGLSIYTIVWLLGDYRAWRARRIELDDGLLHLRVGTRWEAEIPLSEIAEVGLKPEKPVKGDERFIARVWGEPNVWIRFSEPVKLIGMYGVRQRASEVQLHVDDAAEFVSAVNQAVN